MKRRYDANLAMDRSTIPQLITSVTKAMKLVEQIQQYYQIDQELWREGYLITLIILIVFNSIKKDLNFNKLSTGKYKVKLKRIKSYNSKIEQMDHVFQLRLLPEKWRKCLKMN